MRHTILAMMAMGTGLAMFAGCPAYEGDDDDDAAGDWGGDRPIEEMEEPQSCGDTSDEPVTVYMSADDSSSQADPVLMRRSAWQGFLAGVLVNLGNPKSIVFFIGLLPTLFDLGRLTTADIAVILAMSATVPFAGNVVWAAVAHRARRYLSSAAAVRRVNQASGGALAGAGAVVAAT